jgi:alcohol dehydrogenase (cytochrome c)
MDMKSGKILWSHRRKTPSTMSALTTAGGLVVSADWDRYLYIHDVVTGKILYQTRLPGVADGSPSTYSVNGRQYLAIPIGTGSGGTWMVAPRQLLPDMKSPPWEEWPTSVFVFALPQR